MIIRPCRVSAFCVRVVSVVPIIFRKCRINFSTKFLVNRGLFLKSFVLPFHAQISAYACLVNETQSFFLGNTSEKTRSSYIRGLDFDMSIIHLKQ